MVAFVLKIHPEIHLNTSSKALLETAAHNHLEIVQLFVERFLAIGSLDAGEALIRAASYGHSAIVEILLEKRPDIDTITIENALVGAVISGCVQTTTLFLQNRPGIDAALTKHVIALVQNLVSKETIQLLREHLEKLRARSTAPLPTKHDTTANRYKCSPLSKIN